MKTNSKKPYLALLSFFVFGCSAANVISIKNVKSLSEDRYEFTMLCKANGILYVNDKTSIEIADIQKISIYDEKRATIGGVTGYVGGLFLGVLISVPLGNDIVCKSNNELDDSNDNFTCKTGLVFASGTISGALGAVVGEDYFGFRDVDINNLQNCK